MKILIYLAVLIVISSVKGDEMVCENSKGCGKDEQLCPDCCKPSANNQCSRIKGTALQPGDLIGTYFITRLSYPQTVLSPYECFAVNFEAPSPCQRLSYLQFKIRTLNSEGSSLEYDEFPPFIFAYVSSCGRALVYINNALKKTNLDLEEILLNIVVVKKNAAGVAIVDCYAIDDSPVILSYVISPTPTPPAYLLSELVEAIKPYSYNGVTYPVTYAKDCYPSLSALNYTYY